MTTEEKAKAYDEAKLRMSAAYNSNRCTIGFMNEIFPELKESEDERVSKALIHLITEQDGYLTVVNGISTKDILAWLEKQGKQKVSVIDFKAKDWYVSEVDGKIHNAKLIEKSPTNQARKLEIEKAAMSATGIIEQEEWFIKGAEWSDKNPFCISSEKQDEQKLADKVEPKFKNGQWIVWQNKCYKVNYNGCGYELIDQNGLSTSLKYVTVDENAHLWTIQDAKDGDVLAEDSCIFIIQKLGDNSTAAKTYCTLYDDGNFDDGTILYFDIDSTKPATKEQRVLLFQKMKEAGYEWDSEKKELKKIGQSSTWSEEDESIALGIEQIVNCASLLNIAPDKLDKVRDWVKSLRLQKQWKPSEEQMTQLKKYCPDNRPLTSLYEQLKKLKG